MPGRPSGRALSSVRKSVGEPCRTVASRASSARSSGAGEKLESTRIASAPAATVAMQQGKPERMRDRNDHPTAIVLGEPHRVCEKARAFDLAHVLDEHALRDPRRARRVQDGGDLLLERIRAARLVECHLVGPEQTAPDAPRQDARQDVGERIAAVRRNRDDDDGLRVRQHLLELALAQAGAERNGDRAEPPGGEEAGHELRRVRRDEGDSLAPADRRPLRAAPPAAPRARAARRRSERGPRRRARVRVGGLPGRRRRGAPIASGITRLGEGRSSC